MSSTIQKEPRALKSAPPQKEMIITAIDLLMMRLLKVNSAFPEIAGRRRRCCVHAPPAARVYLPYLHMLLFTPEGKMSRLHLNTEITAMADADKPRPPRPPASSRGILFWNLLGNLSTFIQVWEIFGGFFFSSSSGLSGGARFHLHTLLFITKEKKKV